MACFHILIIILILLLVTEWCKKHLLVENLRMQSSHDIRGDPYIPFNAGISSWNIPSNLPYRNREMIMENSGTTEEYRRNYFNNPFSYGVVESFVDIVGKNGESKNSFENSFGIPIGMLIFPLVILYFKTRKQ